MSRFCLVCVCSLLAHCYRSGFPGCLNWLWVSPRWCDWYSYLSNGTNAGCAEWSCFYWRSWATGVLLYPSEPCSHNYYTGASWQSYCSCKRFLRLAYHSTPSCSSQRLYLPSLGSQMFVDWPQLNCCCLSGPDGSGTPCVSDSQQPWMLRSHRFSSYSKGRSVDGDWVVDGAASSC